MLRAVASLSQRAPKLVTYGFNASSMCVETSNKINSNHTLLLSASVKSRLLLQRFAYERQDQRRERPTFSALETLEDLFLGDAPDRTNFDYNKYEKATIEVKGINPPAPISEWKKMNLEKTLLRNIEDAGFAQPILVQQHAIPILMSQRDVMICAQTGSGKTVSFLFPIITQLKAKGAPSPTLRSEGYVQFVPSAIIMTPTRELAQQIHAEAQQFCRGTGVVAAPVFGGTPVMEQLRAMQNNPPHILICTPGRLHDMIERSYVSLKNVNMLVLDEADRMLDMGFEPQIRKIVEESDMPDKNTRNTTMFSATFPREIQQLASQFLRKDHLFLTVGKVGQTAELVKQHFVKIEHPTHKTVNLLKLIKEEQGPTLIFVETKKDVEGVQFQLSSAGIKSEIIHGDRSQAQRNQALNRFSKGTSQVLVATNVASRGIDFKGITHVINYELPPDMDDYVHRIGRTGRAGKAGKATTFISESDSGSSLQKLAELLYDAKQDIPEWLSAVRGGSGRQFRRGNSRGGSAFGKRNDSGFGGAKFGAPAGGFGGGFGRKESGGGRSERFGASNRSSDRFDFNDRNEDRKSFRNEERKSFRKGSGDTEGDFDWSFFDKK